MLIHEAIYEGHTLRSPRPFTDWSPALLLKVAQRLGFRPGQGFMADLLKVDAIFPPEWYPMQRRDRVTRMLVTPVQIDDLMMSLQVLEGRRKMYEKTKRIVLEEGSLPPGDDVERWIDPSDALPAAFRPVRYEHQVPLSETVAALTKRLEALESRPQTPVASELPADVVARIEALETALAMDGAPSFDLGDVSLVTKVDKDARERHYRMSIEFNKLKELVRPSETST